MKPLSEALALTDVGALRAEIALRRKARDLCVGWNSEIATLQARIRTLEATAAAMGEKHDR